MTHLNYFPSLNLLSVFVFSETGWAITASCVGLNMNLNPTPGVTGKPVPGWNGKIWD